MSPPWPRALHTQGISEEYPFQTPSSCKHESRHRDGAEIYPLHQHREPVVAPPRSSDVQHGQVVVGGGHGKLFRLMSPEQQAVLFANTARALGDAPDEVKKRRVDNCAKAAAVRKGCGGLYHPSE